MAQSAGVAEDGRRQVATTRVTPGTIAALSSLPTESELLISISAGSVITTGSAWRQDLAFLIVHSLGSPGWLGGLAVVSHIPQLAGRAVAPENALRE